MYPQRCGYDLRTKFVGVWTQAIQLINFSHKSRRTLYITPREDVLIPYPFLGLNLETKQPP